jgi:hypothetical protein
MSFQSDTTLFSPGRVTTHARRTMMLLDLSRVFEAIAPDEPLEAYHYAVMSENVLLKPTASTRADSFRHLQQLYTFDTSDILFLPLRMLWAQDVEARPVLALLTALARDEVFRTSAECIAATGVGSSVDSGVFADLVETTFAGRYNGTSLRSIGQNIASSWTQSGHLEAQSNRSKVRQHVRATPASVAYALLLGYLTGERGLGLFRTIWVRLLDAAPSELDSLAFAAGKRGWLEYRRIGDIAEFGFAGLLFRMPAIQPNLFESRLASTSARGVHVKS